ncbi:large ribosomal subunit protein uL22m isoform X1 [Odocoileus virginianus]|uniref:Large ribosomal subunit protein uL22m n=1 Tax=Odocoileus virginianus TaxID=9874 RepID=A0ABM4I1V6_ODOVR
MKVRLGIAIRRGKNKNPTKPQIRRIAHAFCAQGVLNSKASVDGGRKMAAVILESLGALWVQNLRGKLALGKPMRRDFPGGPVAKTVLPLQGVQFQHLVGKLRSRMLHSAAKTKPMRLFSSHSILPQSHIHTSASLEISRKWEKKNKIVYPPQLPGEPRRPAIRGMSIDQALAQLEFSDKKGAQIIKEVLLEAQDMAVRDHNVEFRSNLYIAESTSGRGQYLKRIRYHGRGRFGIMEKVFCHYFVKLVEGPPPPPEAPKTAVTHAKEYIQELRNRTIIHAL